MLFNSYHFAIFLPITFLIYWLLGRKKHEMQNVILLLASYVFYACLNPRLLILLFTVSAIAYCFGSLIYKTEKTNRRKNIFLVGVTAEVFILFLFKYYNFFTESINSVFQNIGVQFSLFELNLLLPIGLSFYIFQGISFIIDSYNDKLSQKYTPLTVFTYLSFFPALLSGPIGKSYFMLPQYAQKRNFDYNRTTEGLRQFLWGLFKKVVVADSCAFVVDKVYGNLEMANGSLLFIVAILYSIQIYADFSGYSEMALGTAKLFGINLGKNFEYPYLSRNVAEFWRRWHISLLSWFREYIYFPLGGSRCSKSKVIRNTFIIFLVSGLWHGANWTFILWGIYHAVLFLPKLLVGGKDYKEVVAYSKKNPTIKESFKIVVTFLFITLGWIIFRSANIAQATDFLEKMFSISLFEKPNLQLLFSGFDLLPLFKAIAFSIFMFTVEWHTRKEEFGLQNVNKCNVCIRWIVYLFITLASLFFCEQTQSFVYFNF